MIELTKPKQKLYDTEADRFEALLLLSLAIKEKINPKRKVWYLIRFLRLYTNGARTSDSWLKQLQELRDGVESCRSLLKKVSGPDEIGGARIIEIFGSLDQEILNAAEASLPDPADFFKNLQKLTSALARALRDWQFHSIPLIFLLFWRHPLYDEYRGYKKLLQMSKTPERLNYYIARLRAISVSITGPLKLLINPRGLAIYLTKIARGGHPDDIEGFFKKALEVAVGLEDPKLIQKIAKKATSALELFPKKVLPWRRLKIASKGIIRNSAQVIQTAKNLLRS